MKTKHTALLSFSLITVPLYAFVYMVVTAFGVLAGIGHLTGVVICAIMTPGIYKFCKREAELVQGDSNAERKNTK